MQYWRVRFVPFSNSGTSDALVADQHDPEPHQNLSHPLRVNFPFAYPPFTFLYFLRFLFSLKVAGHYSNRPSLVTMGLLFYSTIDCWIKSNSKLYILICVCRDAIPTRISHMTNIHQCLLFLSNILSFLDSLFVPTVMLGSVHAILTFQSRKLVLLNQSHWCSKNIYTKRWIVVGLLCNAELPSDATSRDFF